MAPPSNPSSTESDKRNLADLMLTFLRFLVRDAPWQQRYLLALVVVLMIAQLVVLWQSDAVSRWVIDLSVVVVFLSIAGTLVVSSVMIHRAGVNASGRCLHLPVFPPEESVRQSIAAALDEIRLDMATELSKGVPSIQPDHIRGNIFLPAQPDEISSDGAWKLVIHRDLITPNMTYPPEWNLQFSIGQGAAGVAFRDGHWQFTQRTQNPDGEWDRKYRMT